MRRAATLAILCAAVIRARPADAQFISRFTVRGEIGAGTMLAQYQTNTLAYGLDIQGSGRLGFSIVDALAIQLSFSSWYFPSTRGDGQQYSYMGGLRLEPRFSFGRIFLDANAGLGQTAGRNRIAFDAGLGIEFQIHPAVGLGPFGRYGILFANDSDAPSHAQYWCAGLSLALRVPPNAPAPPPPPPDSDGDGILDADDQCPHEAAGPRPDPDHRGCPLRDSDGDGIDDPHDLCPHEPQGEHPDPQRAGCPAADSDHDGVFDPQDQCPTTPQGEHPDPERAGCPDSDDDNDGVLNHQDQCPHEAQGLHPDPDRAGCPAPDRDHDMIPDAVDACPDQPGAPSPDPRRNGCPGLVRVENGMIVILHPVFFATGRDRILPNSFPVLQAVADALSAQAEIRKISIEGHTDNVGDDAHNLDLSQRRAQSIVRWLTEHSIVATRLEAHGYGPTRPIQPNTTSAGRAANRRVEFHIIDPAQPGASSSAPPTPDTASGPASAAPPASTHPHRAHSAAAVPAAASPAAAPHHHHHHAH